MKKTLWIVGFMLCIGISCLLLLSSKKHNIHINRAENVLTTLLNAPNSQIKKMYENLFEQAAELAPPETTDIPVLTELTENSARQILIQTFGDNVTDDFITSCLMMNEIITLQYMAITKGFSTKTESLAITEAGRDNQASYEATLILSGSGMTVQEIHVFGRVQLDDDGKINAITVQGQELDRLYEGG